MSYKLPEPSKIDDIIYFFPRLFDKAKYETKWAWQRAFRGFDDRWYWGLSGELEEIIPKCVRHMAKNCSGCPVEFFNKETEGIECKKWEDILEKIARGFEASKEIEEELLYEGDKFMKLDKERKEGLQLFVDNFTSLWD